MKEYKFNVHNPGKGVDANVIGAELEAIYAEHGKVTPIIYVERAADPESPLHPTLEWDDKVAAHAHRLYQARRMIRSVELITESTSNAPAFVYVSPDYGHQPANVVVSKPDMFLLVRERLQKILGSTYRTFDELRNLAEQQQPPNRQRLASLRKVGTILSDAVNTVQAIP